MNDVSGSNLDFRTLLCHRFWKINPTEMKTGCLSSLNVFIWISLARQNVWNLVREEYRYRI